MGFLLQRPVGLKGGRTLALGSLCGLAVFCLVGFLFPNVVQAADSGNLPDISIKLGGSEFASNSSVSASLRIIFLLTALSFAPAVMITMTSFTRIAVVLGMTRTALGTASLPPNMVITGLSLFLTMSIMSPVFNDMYQSGVRPFLEGQMTEAEAFDKTTAPLKRFLVRHAREKDLALFLDITRTEMPEEPSQVPFHVAASAFVLSELNTAFQIGFLIALPFLVLDMVVSSVLTSMSMITLPPVVISLPLKMMLFVVVDGWHLIIASVIKTYHVN